jgi:hypothetical protein
MYQYFPTTNLFFISPKPLTQQFNILRDEMGTYIEGSSMHVILPSDE